MGLPKAWMSWSTGKDSAWALHRTRKERKVEVTALLTTVNQAFRRVAMHAVREELLDAQGEAVKLPLVKVPLPWPCPNAAYEAAMEKALAQAREAGVAHLVFGDLFLEDIRKYREEKMAGTGLTPLFPIWGLDTAQLAQDMIASGLEAYLTCVDPKKLDRSFAGRAFDSRLLPDLPSGVDPCGENGEFHTFTFAGPMFRHRISARLGRIEDRDGFVFADVLAGGGKEQRASGASMDV